MGDWAAESAAKREHGGLDEREAAAGGAGGAGCHREPGCCAGVEAG